MRRFKVTAWVGPSRPDQYADRLKGAPGVVEGSVLSGTERVYCLFEADDGLSARLAVHGILFGTGRADRIWAEAVGPYGQTTRTMEGPARRAGQCNV